MNRRRAFFLAVNLVLFLALLWAHAPDLLVVVRAEGDTLTAYLEGYTLQASVPRPAPVAFPTRSTVGLHWEDTGPATTPLARFQEGMASLFYYPYWGEVKATPLGQGEEPGSLIWGGLVSRFVGFDEAPRLGVDFPFPTDEGAQDYELRATLGRGENFSRILVRGSSTGDGYLFWFRPLHEDMGWQALRGGRAAEGLASAGFRMSLPQTIKPVLRIVLGSYFVGLLLAGLFWLARKGLRRRAPEDREARVPSAAAGLGASAARGWLWAAVALAALGAVVVAAWINTELLGRIPHVQDSVAYLFQAKTLALGRLATPSPPLPEFFEHEFILNRDGLWFGKYPPGHPLVLVVGVLTGYPWLVGPVMGGLFLVVLFLLGKEIYGPKVAAVAVLLGLSSPFFLFMSASFMAHPTSLLFITLFMLGLVKMRRAAGPSTSFPKGRTGHALAWAILAGFALGMAFITRQLSAVALALPFALVAAYDLTTRSRWALPRYGLMVAAAAPPLLFYLWYNWQLIGNPLTTPFELWWDFDRLGFGPTVGMRGGHTLAEGFINTWRNLNALVVHLFGWPPYLTLALLPLPFALGRARRWDWLLGAAFLSLVGAHVFYWADGIMYGPRYYYEALPALLLLSARGLQSFPSGRMAQVGLARVGAGAWAGVVMAGALLVSLVGANLAGYLPQQLELFRHYDPYQPGANRNYNYVSPQALEVVRRADLHQAVVFVEHEPTWQWWKYGEVFSANSPLLDTDVVYARDLGARNRELAPFFPGRAFYVMRGGRLFPLDIDGGGG